MLNSNFLNRMGENSHVKKRRNSLLTIVIAHLNISEKKVVKIAEYHLLLVQYFKSSNISTIGCKMSRNQCMKFCTRVGIWMGVFPIVARKQSPNLN